MKSYFSFIPRKGEILSPALCRTIIYELRELLSSKSKTLIAIPGSPKPSPCEQCLIARYYFYRRFPNQLDLCDFSSGHKASKRSGFFLAFQEEMEGGKHSTFRKSNQQKDTFSSMLCTAETTL